MQPAPTPTQPAYDFATTHAITINYANASIIALQSCDSSIKFYYYIAPETVYRQVGL